MNPFDLRGPKFLYFILIALAVAIGIAWLWRRLLIRGRSRLDTLDIDSIGPFEVAFLSGGVVGAVNAAITSLVHRELLDVDDGELVQTRRRGDRYDLHPLEHAVLHAVGGGAQTLPDVVASVEDEAEEVAQTMEEEGLVLSAAKRRQHAVMVLLLPIAVLAVGVVKLVIGVQRHAPIGYLLMILIGGIFPLPFLARMPTRTRAGDLVLEELRGKYAALQATATSDPSMLDSRDAALAYGLYGNAVFVGGLGVLSTFLIADVAMASMWGGYGCSSCSSCSSCGGCGGGCGGCGGCS